ncbi:MAG: hypothetical protein J6M02_06180 [Clostridia bacterium]|nr:hypothetical protein [Clostridia bacterium]
MENEKTAVKSLEAMLNMLPEDLTNEEKEKVAEIRGMLKNISKKIDREE